MRLSSFHYGWVVVFAGMLGVFACIGLGRFSIGMLLPSMSSDLGLNYSQMGLIGTANFIGYLIAVLVSGKLIQSMGSRKLISFSLLLICITMIVISFAQGLWSVLIPFILTGMGSGSANVPIMVLMSTWFSRSLRGRATGFVVIGSGFAILLSGKLIPWINTMYGSSGWRINWLLLGLFVGFAAFLCWILLRDNPREMGLSVVGRGDDGERFFKTGQGGDELEPVLDSRLPLAHVGAIYFLFGYTYVIYATFIVTLLINERGFDEATAGNLWAWVGFLSLFSGPIFGTLSDRLGRKIVLVIVFTIQFFAYLFISLSLPDVYLYVSIGMFGLVAWSVPTIIAALVGDFWGPRLAANVFGFITFLFGIGQILGPYMSGILAQQSGHFSSSFTMAAILVATAAFLSLLLSKTLQSEQPI